MNPREIKKAAKLDKKLRRKAYKNGNYVTVTDFAAFSAPLSELPFCEADVATLCQLSYCHFDNYIGWQLMEIASSDFDETAVAPYITDLNAAVVRNLASSARLGTARVLEVVDAFDETVSCQCGVTLFDFADRYIFVCRGTDEKMIGWYEDFDLVIKGTLPSHRITVDALNEFMAKYTDKPFVVAGHSKGGNMALYASANCAETNQDRIETVYNLDGPGLLDGVADADGMKRIMPKVVKICPELSFFGMILQKDEPRLEVVYSHAKDITQHDLLKWQIDKKTGKLVRAYRLSHASHTVRRTIERMLPKLSEQDLLYMRDFIVSVMGHAGIFVFNDITAKRLLALPLKCFKQPGKQRRFMWRILFRVIGNAIAVQKLSTKDYKTYLPHDNGNV